MLSFGFVGAHYAGTYQMLSGGVITARFDSFEREWPEMLLDVDGRDLILWPQNADERAGELPYRQLHGEDAVAVQETWHEWSGTADP
jgi:hypothetical protein